MKLEDLLANITPEMAEDAYTIVAKEMKALAKEIEKHAHVFQMVQTVAEGTTHLVAKVAGTFNPNQALEVAAMIARLHTTSAYSFVEEMRAAHTKLQALEKKLEEVTEGFKDVEAS